MDGIDDDIVRLQVSRLDHDIEEDELMKHIARVTGGTVVNLTLHKGKKKSLRAIVDIRTNFRAKRLAKTLRKAEFSGSSVTVTILNAPRSEKAAKNFAEIRELASRFHRHMTSDETILERCTDREEIGVIFRTFLEGVTSKSLKEKKRIEASVMTHLRHMKLLKSKRYGETVVTTVARSGPGDFPDNDQVRKERRRLLEKHANEEANKNGVAVSIPSLDGMLVPVKETAAIEFSISNETPGTVLTRIRFGGTGKDLLAVDGSPFQKELPDCLDVRIIFRSRGFGLCRANVRFDFEGPTSRFTILRPLKIRSGDAAAGEILKPESPYQEKWKGIAFNSDNVFVPPPPQPSSNTTNPFVKLPMYWIPEDVREMIRGGELETVLQKPEKIEDYGDFWKCLLWASEFQASQDIKLYDMEGAKLGREGRHMVLRVPGLAEGRPSVLRGDLVIAQWGEKTYKGRVILTRMLEVVLEFDRSFHEKFNTSLDAVDIRFTFSRTTFRTSHEGCVVAEFRMGKPMLFPAREDAIAAVLENRKRAVAKLHWANRALNEEQMAAVTKIVEGTCRPLPYIIFGPPGTGKTTTVVEAVYQLARHPSQPKILLVAPSNDAADILVEKLSSTFPPSEMLRILAYSRSLDQLPPEVRRYGAEGLSGRPLADVVMAARIVVSTVNNASRLAWHGVPSGHFDVLCVDEAGHSTEPEVIAVASTLFDFQGKSQGVAQIVLAGDPKQLGPVVTSMVCRKFGLSVSYMERLASSELYARNEENRYPAGLITKLVRNYRSHPAILKLPNEFFYDNDLVVSGDVISTHNLARWEHLPAQGFPVVFHAIHGDNQREGRSPSWFNPEEAQEVANYVDLLINQTRPPLSQDEIGVVTPYARQAQKIRALLKHINFPDIKVGSVEIFQGQERRCIIISTVRAETEHIASDLKYNLGFVANSKRFNVAVTRAKSLLIVIGDPNVLATDKKNWLPFLMHCKENGSWRGDPWTEDTGEADSVLGSQDSESQDDEWQLIDAPSIAAFEFGGFINSEE